MTRSRLQLTVACAALMLLLPTWMWASADVEVAPIPQEDAETHATPRETEVSRAPATALRRPVRGRRVDPASLPSERDETDATAETQAPIEKNIGSMRCGFRKIDLRWYQAKAAGIPEASREAARDLAVGDAVLELAFEAFLANLRYDKDPKPLDKLAGHGGEAFRAVVALLRGGLTDAAAGALLKRTFVIGEERNLLDAAQALEGGGHHAAALALLGSADAPAVREHLLQRMETETDAVRFAACATSLGRLGERRAMTTCAVALRNDTWGGGPRRDICAAMVAIDASAAAEAFVDHLRRQDTDFLDGAADYLAAVDPALAAREADLLLHGRLADPLSDGRADCGGDDQLAALRKRMRQIASWKPAPQSPGTSTVSPRG